jgi:hypothetical protein
VRGWGREGTMSKKNDVSEKLRERGVMSEVNGERENDIRKD